VYPDGKRVVTPDLSIRQITTTAKYITSSIGVDLAPEKVVRLLDKMSLSGKLHDDKNTITISIPPTRSDVLHACDVMEDVAIAYGFNNIPKTLPATNTIAAPFVINKLSDMIRKEVALAGFSEVLPLILVLISPFYSLGRYLVFNKNPFFLLFFKKKNVVLSRRKLWVPS
jgi:phenylalanyl-tRNA synthetase beta chain